MIRGLALGLLAVACGGRAVADAAAPTRTAGGGTAAAVSRIVPSRSTGGAGIRPTGSETGASATAATASDLAMPVDIRGKNVTYEGKAGRAVFTGGVVVTRGPARLTSDRLVTVKGTEEAVATGHVVFHDEEHQLDLTCDEIQYRNGLRHLTAAGHCQLIQGGADDVSVVTSESMEVFVDRREALAHEHVRIVQGENEALCADAHLYGAEDRLVLTGRPILRRPPHEFECDQVETFFKEGRSVLTGKVTGTLHTGSLQTLQPAAGGS